MYDQLEVEWTWIKGRDVEGFDPDVWRLDSEGRLMKFSEIGKHSEFGWKVHQLPTIYTGSIGLLGLVPRHWRDN